MKVARLRESHRALRSGRVWMLLAADLAPEVLALLESVFGDEAKVLEGSVLVERLTRELELLRAHDVEMPQSAKGYLDDWLAQGWLTRRLLLGATEEIFELTAEALTAIRFVATLQRPRVAATESRLANVMQQVIRLAEDTDADPRTRLAALQVERDRIDQEMAAVSRGEAKVLPEDRALERAREVITLAEELAADFRNVRDAFDRLNRELRQSLIENDGSRADVLEHLFAGVDLISESDAGKTFNAFWKLLTNAEQSSALSDALDAVTSRPFARQLAVRERRFLHSMTSILRGEGGDVHDVLQQFARSLKSFVQSREFQEQRRLHGLLRQTQQAAMQAKNVLRVNEGIGFTLTLTSSKVDSITRWSFYDPGLRLADTDIRDVEESSLSLAEIEEMVRSAEIDLRTLTMNVRTVLLERPFASIRDVLDRFPAEQGLGSVIGYVHIGTKCGEVTDLSERVEWVGNDGQRRAAKLPSIVFVRERQHELEF